MLFVRPSLSKLYRKHSVGGIFENKNGAFSFAFLRPSWQLQELQQMLFGKRSRRLFLMKPI
jgi:hypothetical protein